MKKTKLSLTLLITLAFMLMLSTVVAAAAPAPTLTGTVGDKQVILDWNEVSDTDPVIEYNVYKDGVLLTTVADDGSLTFSYTATGLTNGTVYKFEVAAVSSPDAGVTKNEGAKASYTTPGLAAWNAEMSQITDTQADGGVDFNANLTGSGVDSQNNAGEVIKSDGMTSTDGTQTQRTHGEYHNNTNSCASCHQTHTGASKSLLFKDGVYNTCSACHDGTLGFYNVFESHSELGSAGTFGGTEAGNMSVHLANGATKLSAAPGGNLNGTGSWTKEFNCASCHSPHGSYSDRLLHYSPNSMAKTAVDDGGIAAIGAAVMSFTDYTAKTAADWNTYQGDGTTVQYLVRGTKTELGIVNADMLSTDVAIQVKKVYAYTSYGVKKVTKTDLNTPWLYGYEYGKPKNYWTRFYTVATDGTSEFTKVDGDYDKIIDDHDQEGGTIHFEYDKGYIWANGTELNGVLSGDVARAYVVKLDLIPKWDVAVNDTVVVNGTYDAGEEQKFGDLTITTVNQRALYAGEINPLSTNVEERWGLTPDPVTGEFADVSGWGIAASDYCASCHTDYLAKSGSSTGTWNQAYRHSTTSDSYTCVRCHFAHGTDVTVMRDAQNNTAEELVTLGDFANLATAEAYMLDKNNSSALKRYTNMSVCWACHTSSKAEQLKNTDSYGDATDPHGLSTEEGKQNWPN